MVINSLSELKAYLPNSEWDFKGRPYILESRLNRDPVVRDFFERTRSQWTYVHDARVYKLADNVTVR